MKDKKFLVIADLFSNSEAKLPNSIAIWKTGVYQPSFSDPRTIVEKDLDDIVQNFKKNVLKTKVSVFYSHWDSRRTAAGEVKDLWTSQNPGQEEVVLHAEIEWTPSGKKSIIDKEYKYVSSEVVWNFSRAVEGGKFDEFGTVLTGIALTNEPAVYDLPPIIFSTKNVAKNKNTGFNNNNSNETGDSKMKELLKLMGVESEGEAIKKFSSLSEQIAKMENSKEKDAFSKQLKEKEDEVTSLKKKIEEMETTAFSNEKKSFLNEAFKAEKIDKGSYDKAMEYSREQFSVFKEVIGNIKGKTLMQPAGTSTVSTGEGEGEPELSLANFAKDYKEEDFLKGVQ